MTDTAFGDLQAALETARLAWEARSPGDVEEAERVRAAELAAYRLGVWRARYNEAAPVRVAAAAWEPAETLAVKAVRDWLADSRGRHLVLRGGVGCGKSSAACVAVKAWVEPPAAFMSDCGPAIRVARPDVVWLRPNQLVSAVLHDYDEKSPKLRKHVVLDDVGLETSADFEVALCELLDRGEYVLLITTNLTRAKFRERYGVRLLDRLNGMAFAVDLPEKSLRKQDGNF